jgi:N-acyl-L-homoserine lactone synthetase
MVDYCLSQRIGVLTGVVEAGFRAKVLEMGWRCSALGEVKRFGSAPLGAFRLEIETDTPERLCRTGIYSPRTLRSVLPDQVAA